MTTDAYAQWVPHWTCWRIASGEDAHKGDAVRLDDGREGVIVRVSRDRRGRLDGRGLPEVDVDGEMVAVPPARIAALVR